ncbi:hypothetical protein D1646_21880, partial [Pseudoflavonifractor sp. 60]|nr:hypothetical protein [Pseudoflavonifractor sp. 60]
LGARTYTPGTQAQTIANGQYLSGVQTIQGDPNLTSGNIKKGVSIFGVDGAVEQSFLATLTVTSDVGAVVTATHSGGTEVEGLSATGTVVLELPLEGTWKVTAVRGVAQYNTVTIQVTSQYNAALTAEVHVEYFGDATPLSSVRKYLSAASTDSHAIFAGGQNKRYDGVLLSLKHIDVYDANLTRDSSHSLLNFRYRSQATSLGGKVFLGGGLGDVGANGAGTAVNIKKVEQIDNSLTITELEDLTNPKSHHSATSISNHAIFGGGAISSGESTASVDAYDQNSTHTTPVQLSTPCSDLAAASNDNYAVFAGGNEASGVPTAYDSSLTRVLLTSLSVARTGLAAARAGNYVVFAGGRNRSANPDTVLDSVDAYDLFLTRTTPEPLSVARHGLQGSTLKDTAVFAGGFTGWSVGICGIVESYDPFLVRQVQTELKVQRAEHGAASIGSYALFGGGCGGAEAFINSVEAYRYV